MVFCGHVRRLPTFSRPPDDSRTSCGRSIVALAAQLAHAIRDAGGHGGEYLCRRLLCACHQARTGSVRGQTRAGRRSGDVLQEPGRILRRHRHGGCRSGGRLGLRRRQHRLLRFSGYRRGFASRWKRARGSRVFRQVRSHRHAGVFDLRSGPDRHVDHRDRSGRRRGCLPDGHWRSG